MGGNETAICVRSLRRPLRMLPYYLVIMSLCTGRQNIPVLSSPPSRTSLIYVPGHSFEQSAYGSQVTHRSLPLAILVPHAKYQSQFSPPTYWCVPLLSSI